MFNLIEFSIFLLVFLEPIRAEIFDNETIDNENTTAAHRRTYQITTILDRLLKNYDANIRPNFGGKSIFDILLFRFSLKIKTVSIWFNDNRQAHR